MPVTGVGVSEVKVLDSNNLLNRAVTGRAISRRVVGWGSQAESVVEVVAQVVIQFALKLEECKDDTRFVGNAICNSKDRRCVIICMRR